MTTRDDLDPVDAAALVIERHSAIKVRGVLLDAQTARAITAVHNALSPANPAKFRSMPIEKAGAIAWRLVR